MPLAVNRKENQNDGGRSNSQNPACVLKAVRKEVRKRQRIVLNLGVDAKARGNEFPVKKRPDDEADREPALADAG